MGAIKDLVDLVTQLTNSVQDRKVASELREIQKMIADIQTEHASLHEQRIELMTENAELKQTIASLKKETAKQNRPNIQEELHEEYGVNWNKEYKKRCLYCESPLKYASEGYGPSILFCSGCDRKHVLRDTKGNLITEETAIERLKNANQRVNLTP